MKNDPISIRLRPDTRKRLAEFLDGQPMLSAGDVANLALRELFRILDSGGEIRISAQGTSLLTAAEASPREEDAPRNAPSVPRKTDLVDGSEPQQYVEPAPGRKTGQKRNA
jgi:hypothetical protein